MLSETRSSQPTEGNAGKHAVYWEGLGFRGHVGITENYMDTTIRLGFRENTYPKSMQLKSLEPSFLGDPSRSSQPPQGVLVEELTL